MPWDRRARALALIVCAAVPPSVPGAARAGGDAAVSVAFHAPETYVDARQFGSAATGADAAVLRRIRAHLERLGARLLAPGQHLSVEVLQIDLAGMRLGAGSPEGVRIVTAADWPRLELRYVLTEGGAPRLAGTETVADPDFLRRGGPYAAGSLRYELRMLEAWFRARILARRPPPE